LGQMKVARRMILAVANAVPSPLRTEANAMMPLQEMPATGEMAEVQMPIGADAAEAKPFAFDVVSIRPAVPPASDGRPRIGYKFTDDGFVANSSLLMTLVFQYLPELQGDSTRIVGGPDWVRTIPWEIRAKVADSDIAEWSKLSDDPSPKAKRRQRATVDAMLAERFKLKTHLESRESAIYALVVSKGGPNLKPAKPDARAGFTSGPGRFSSQTVTLGLVVQLLGHELGRPVIDKTGLTGNYNITLNWAPTQGGAGGEAAQAADSAAPSLFTAVQEQLGLKLEAQKGAVEHLVIDSAEKPSVDGAEVRPASAMPPVAQDAAEQHQTNGSPQPQMMAKDADPDWDVVTVKPSAPSDKGDYMDIHGRHWTFERETVEEMLGIGYGVQKRQLVGEPDWARTDRWDVDGLSDTDGEPDLKQLQSMMRKVLGERFGLKLHNEQRQMPVFALTVAKGGPKLTENTTDPNGTMDQNGGSGNGWKSSRFSNATMRDLALILDFHVDRPVVDQTGLKARYDFRLKWLTDDSHATDPDAPPGIFTAIQEQLGLKLEPVKAATDVLVVDHVDRPSAN
ncbi:MAG: TIGR03435 family protein, partial [Acidobacteriota bacterium]|nr:TIGR03435 family protein [Acidobacteriota bacterium]